MSATQSSPRSFLLKVENQIPTVVAVSTDNMSLVNRQIELEDERIAAGIPISQMFYCVRGIDDVQGLTKQALANIKLTPKQREGLNDLVRALRHTSRSSIRPGNMGGRWEGYGHARRWTGPVWHGMDTRELARVGKVLHERGLIRMTGVAYGPKTYSVTALGHAVAEVQA